ncbi:hypothetical protein GQ457_06G000750 [Hibiscus cannabinus]
MGHRRARTCLRRSPCRSQTDDRTEGFSSPRHGELESDGRVSHERRGWSETGEKRKVAAKSQEVICGEEVCGNVTFPSPFGIHHNCYNLSWFRVTCEGNKPFININGINLDVLGPHSSVSINVNYPVTPVNCNRKLDITGADIDLAGTPFFLSGCITSIVSISLLIVTWQMRKAWKKRQDIKQKHKYFKRNGVQGTFGYMDPEYFRSNQFTEKSDVDSFGIVLVELLTGRKLILLDQSQEARSLVSYFLLSMQQDSLFDILDSTMVNGNPEEIIAMDKLARRCLNLNGKKRPTMKQVAMELELIKTSKAGASIDEAKSQEVICGEEVCGNVTFPPPFGIHHNCYNLSWFRVTCKGNKPFINIKGINLELLGSYSMASININYPVTTVNCNRKLDITAADVDLAGTPFFLSGYYNYFGSVGCGNLATISTNSTDSIGGCVQPKCGRKAGGSGSGCYTEIIGKLTSYTVSMVDMYGSKRSCVSAFMFSSSYFDNGYPLPVEINSETTHVPVTLEWDSSYCGDSAPGPVNLFLFNQTTCGEVDFDYPFGVRNQQHSKSRFEVDCIETANGEQTPFLNINGIDLQILEFSFVDSTVVVNHSVTYFSCRGSNNNGTSLNLEGTPFYYDIHNIFWSSGCGNLVTLFDKRDGNFIGGCSQPSCRIRNETSSSAGCRIFFPPGLNSFFANIGGGAGSSDYSSKRSCGFASPVYSGLYGSLNLSDLNHVPISLKWGAPKRGSCQLNQGSAISCSSDGKYCWKSLNTSHLCVCTAKNIIDLGTNCEGMYCGEYRWCHILCLNTRDNYCLSLAPPTRKTLNFKIIMIGCITSVVSISLLIAENSLFDILDSTIVNDSPMEEITAMAKLARRCLNLNGKRRPTMKQVAMELELIRASEAGVDIEECGDEESETDEIKESWNANLSWSTSISIATESTTLPLNQTF